MPYRWFVAEVRIIEWVSAIFAFLWGIWFCVGMVDYDRPAYALMATIAPYWVWGGIVASYGLALAICLYMEYRKVRKRVLRSLFLIWLGVGLCLGLPNPYSSGFFTYFYVATIHGIAYIRLVNRDGPK